MLIYKSENEEQILRPIYKNSRGADFEAHLKKSYFGMVCRSKVFVGLECFPIPTYVLAASRAPG